MTQVQKNSVDLGVATQKAFGNSALSSLAVLQFFGPEPPVQTKDLILRLLYETTVRKDDESDREYILRRLPMGSVNVSRDYVLFVLDCIAKRNKLDPAALLNIRLVLLAQYSHLMYSLTPPVQLSPPTQPRLTN